MHRDSVGAVQAIQPNEVNWMIAGRGITHSERFEKARANGGLMHGIQSWVALPKEYEEIEPSFGHFGSEKLPVHEDGGTRTRLIAGSAFGLTAGVTTHSPLFYAHWELAPGARAALPDDYSERALYIAAGEIELRGQRYGAGKMLGSTRTNTAPSRRRNPPPSRRSRNRSRSHRVEFRVILEGTHRTGQGRLARRPHEAP
jgi:redox-sensitive bicupin YhaK (pirin superfamily)